MSDNIDAQVRKNIQSIPTGTMRRLLRDVSEALGRATSVAEAEASIHKAALLGTQGLSEHMACRNRCSHCCYQAVAISVVEAKRIADYIGYKKPLRSLPGKVDGDYLSYILQSRERYHGVACPFLVDGVCSVYPVRPFECALWFNVSDDPSLCDTRLGVQSIPAINMSEIHAVRATMLFVNEVPVYDIRDFFDKGELDGCNIATRSPTL